MNFERWLMLAITCSAGIASGDAPRIDGHVALGARASSTTEPYYHDVVDDTAAVRVAAEGVVGLRFGRSVVGLHAGIATPLRFYSSLLMDSGEVVASTSSTIYPLDVGLGAQLDAGARFWISAWLGATVAFARASSPAAHISAIDFTGDIPARSWSDYTTSLGLGAALGFDVVKNEHGRLAALVTLESQGIGKIPLRYNDGQTGNEAQDLTSRSITLGVAYRY